MRTSAVKRWRRGMKRRCETVSHTRKNPTRRRMYMDMALLHAFSSAQVPLWLALFLIRFLCTRHSPWRELAIGSVGIRNSMIRKHTSLAFAIQQVCCTPCSQGQQKCKYCWRMAWNNFGWFLWILGQKWIRWKYKAQNEQDTCHFLGGSRSLRKQQF